MIGRAIKVQFNVKVTSYQSPSMTALIKGKPIDRRACSYTSGLFRHDVPRNDGCEWLGQEFIGRMITAFINCLSDGYARTLRIINCVIHY